MFLNENNVVAKVCASSKTTALVQVLFSREQCKSI